MYQNPPPPTRQPLGVGCEHFNSVVVVVGGVGRFSGAGKSDVACVPLFRAGKYRVRDFRSEKLRKTVCIHSAEDFSFWDFCKLWRFGEVSIVLFTLWKLFFFFFSKFAFGFNGMLVFFCLRFRFWLCNYTMRNVYEIISGHHAFYCISANFVIEFFLFFYNYNW